MPETTEATFAGWGIVEVMGHKKFAGYVSEQPIAGSALLRVDVPATEPLNEADRQPATAAYSKLVGVGSIYCLTPTTEDVARRAARVIERYNDPLPVSLPMPRALVAGPRADEDADAEVDSDDDDLPY